MRITLFMLFGSVIFSVWPRLPNRLNKNNYVLNKLLKYVQLPSDENISYESSAKYWDTLLASETLTGNQLLQYFLWTNHSSCKLSRDIGGVMLNNPPGLDGKKAVCFDPKVAPKAGKCLVYSFGINNEWSFDEEMANYGCEVFSFDPSMGVNNHDHSPGNVHFYNWGLGDQNENDQNLNWTIRSLSTIYETLSVRHDTKIIDYLKIDIEYSEWIALPNIIKSGMFSKVRQLGVEVHFEITDSLEQIRECAKLLRRIEKLGMIRFDSQINPWYVGNFTKFPLTGSLGYEIAWYNGKLLHL
jgi:hypothetical protein